MDISEDKNFLFHIPTLFFPSKYRASLLYGSYDPFRSFQESKNRYSLITAGRSLSVSSLQTLFAQKHKFLFVVFCKQEVQGLFMVLLCILKSLLPLQKKPKTW